MTRQKKRFDRVLNFAFSVWLTLIPLNDALAHDPGMSITELSFADNGLNAHLIFARPEIEQFVVLDQDNDDSVSEVEFAAARDDLRRLATELIEIDLNGLPLEMSLSSLQLDASDGVHFRLEVKGGQRGTLGIGAPLIDQFARGHRQHLTVKDTEGRAQTGILSADRNRLEFDLQQPDEWVQFRNYLREGVWHIWIGYDHILFLLALLLPSVLTVLHGRWLARDDFRSTLLEVVKIVSAFTVAHSITLGLAIFDLVSAPGRVVESIIAASVIAAALNNLRQKVQTKLWLLVFTFGLIHGLGFAGVLSELGLPDENRGWALLAFNLGVELGQLAIVVVLLPLIYSQRKRSYYRPVYVQAGSWLIAGIATLWLIERVANVELFAWV